MATITSAQIARLRRIVNEPTTATYSDDSLEEIISRYPTPDVRGMNWQYLDYSTDPPTVSENPDWIPSYDLYAAGAEVWQEKAAAVACAYATSADGVSLQRNQMYEQYTRQAAWCKSRASVGVQKFVRTDIYRDAESGEVVETTNLIIQQTDEDNSN